MLAALALASAVLYGAADFLGGLASRRTGVVAIVVISQLAGLIVLASMLPLLPPSSPGADAWTWGAVAGVCGGIGVALLYHALAIGSMAIVAPITAVCAVCVPVAAAVALGERPGPMVAAGIVLAVVAIVLVSRGSTEPAPKRGTRGAGIALMSGVAIGLFFLALAQSADDAGPWPLVAARAVSVSLFAVIALVTRQPVTMPRRVAAVAVGCGILDMLANLLYLIATRYGELTIVVTLASLYPASTVLLARVILKERLSGGQAAGVVCALAAVILIVGSR